MSKCSGNSPIWGYMRGTTVRKLIMPHGNISSVNGMRCDQKYYFCIWHVCRYRDGKRITVVDCGDKAAEWLAEVVGKELRLVCHLHIVKGQKQSKKVKSDHGLVFKVFR